MNVAILTFAGDHHAHAVAWGLARRGHDCDLIFFGDLPQLATITIDPTRPDGVAFASESFSTDLAKYDRFWLRRPSEPILPASLHPSDRGIARQYWNFTIDSLLRSLGETKAFCINPPIGSEATRLKAFQLALAQQAGLRVPRTVITTNGEAARRFVRENRDNGRNTIVKSLYCSIWDMEDGGIAVLDTTRISEAEIADGSLRLAPCIFQIEETKRSEARVTIMGRTIFAAELDSQNIPEARIDFRLAPDWNRLGCKPIAVPEPVKEALLRFQDKAGLNFGTMDFIIDPDGDWIFLETNPMGQFLWIENAHPETTLLDAFVEFLLSGTDAFVYPGSRDGEIRLAAFKAAETGSLEFLYAERDRHVKTGPMTAPDQPLAPEQRTMAPAGHP